MSPGLPNAPLPPPPPSMPAPLHEVQGGAWRAGAAAAGQLAGLPLRPVFLPSVPPPPPCCSPIAVNLLVEAAKTLFALGTLIAYVSMAALAGWAGGRTWFRCHACSQPAAAAADDPSRQRGPRPHPGQAVGSLQLTKLTAARCVLFGVVVQGTGRVGTPMYRSWRAFVRDARHNHLLIIPAALYAVRGAREGLVAGGALLGWAHSPVPGPCCPARQAQHAT